MCILNGTTFRSCPHGIRTFWRCLTYTGPAPTAGELPTCPQFLDRRVQVDFPCVRCTGADIYTQKDPQERSALPAPKPAETHDETMKRARLARVASEERMCREGTTLEEEHRRSRESKEVERRIQALVAMLEEQWESQALWAVATFNLLNRRRDRQDEQEHYGSDGDESDQGSVEDSDEDSYI
ncbi:hypothetical protein MMC15_005763 [Xylographa vitiligo]|nr:hypothetical protein [Xylographa vitiligo]